ncbi:Na/Pi cotransporter family protein [Roseibium suaedae]|uniref:Phosphate:Na+ symporter n=1 Tax=Roseibium suaedae TaxID=735517 RepID=A0A1M7PRH0_9HYPH|nr:Na/Pi cotransporter family protein [Roseibium suaedae]SHN19952.1 phosphate:Na+ symporter [Roseibium suaedae]
MESAIVTINLLGAVALLLFGLAQVKTGVTQAFGARLRTGLAKGTKTGARSFLSGFVATIALQSSTATALMISSFVEKALVAPRMAQVVLLGANVGTAVTAWIVATGIEWISPLVIFTGLILYRSQLSARSAGGKALIGVGLMLLSLHLLGGATEPLRQSPALAAFIGLLENAWPVALVFAGLIAFLSSSSLAGIILITSITSTGVLSDSLIVVLVLGANLGGAIPPVIATLGEGAAGRRVALSNLIVRACGCAVALPLAGYAGEALAYLEFPLDRLAVDAHLGFNLVLAAAAWPFSGMLARVMSSVVPDQDKADSGPRYLSESELSQPVVALASATREVLGVGDVVEKMLLDVHEAFEHGNQSILGEVPALEKKVDLLQQEVKLYLSRLAQDGLSDQQSRRSIQIIDYAINLEHIGDIVEKGLMPQVAKKLSQGLVFSRQGQEELSRLFELTIDNLRVAQTIMTTGDFNLAKQMMDLKVEVRRLEKQSAQRHLERLRDGMDASRQTSSLHLDLLRDLKRINAHIISVAHPILDESGLLIESRLRA